MAKQSKKGGPLTLEKLVNLHRISDLKNKIAAKKIKADIIRQKTNKVYQFLNENK